VKFVSISDLHIRESSDQGAQALQSFFDHPATHSAETVLFLGDIFDLMAGFHKQYYEKYMFFFEGVLRLLEQGKKVFFFEGNHDMHLKKLFNYYFKKYGSQLELVRGEKVLKLGSKTICFTHGDDLQVDPKYQAYKKVVTSWPMGFLANNIFSFDFIEKIGQKASKKSREVSSGKFDYQSVKDACRQGAIKYSSTYDILVAGHSHVLDKYEFKGFTYINNGFPSKDKKFIASVGDGVELVDLV
jgi:UDP-2,3-diacylglucosamine hydrolase